MTDKYATGKWYPIDTAPKDESVLICEDGVIAVAHWWSCISKHDGRDIGHWTTDCVSGFDWEFDLRRPTHWMPLPDPPVTIDLSLDFRRAHGET